VAKGDEVVERLLTERGRALTAYAYLLCGNVADAEDLVSDALVRTFTRRRAGLELRSAESYVRRSILTLYVDGWRKRNRWASRWPVAAGPDSTESPENHTADRMLVMTALRELSRQQRACIVLRYYEDRTVAEIADQLALSDGTVKRYLSLGIRRLVGLLGPIPEHSAASVELVKEA
jgi:RNA polymerase sigma-70 factor (sigma-E family)